MDLDGLKKEFIPKYQKVGNEKFYNFLITYAINKLIAIDKEDYKGIYPDVEFLNYYEKFLILYRRESEDIHLDIAKIFRKAAHKIHRIMIKKQITKTNNKFLRAV
jgi:hypothetical protein